MDIVNKILSDAPSHWDVMNATSYHRSYVLVELSSTSREYQTIYHKISRLRACNYVKRVQNPFQLGLFNVMKEKRREEGRPFGTKTGYHILYEDDLNTALKYWLDYRRYESAVYGQQSTGTKYTKFFATIDEALNAFPRDDKTKCIIECQIFIDSGNNFNVESQADFLPTYVICF